MMEDRNTRMARQLVRLAKEIAAENQYTGFAERLKEKGWEIDHRIGIASKRTGGDFITTYMTVDIEDPGRNPLAIAWRPPEIRADVDAQFSLTIKNLEDIVKTVKDAQAEVDSCFNGR